MAKYRQRAEVDAWPIRSFVTAGLDKPRGLMGLGFMPPKVQDGVECGHIAWDQESDTLVVWTSDGLIYGELDDWLIRDDRANFDVMGAMSFTAMYEPA